MPKVLTASQTNTQIDDDVRNPSVNPGAQGRHVVHCTLVFEGVEFIPNDLYDALDAEYATVAYEHDAVARGCYVFNISA
jgi:hypothetical protein